MAYTRIRATPARLIGYVQAPDAEQAVKEAIARYGIDKSARAGPAGRAAGERDRLDADWPRDSPADPCRWSVQTPFGSANLGWGLNGRLWTDLVQKMRLDSWVVIALVMGCGLCQWARGVAIGGARFWGGIHWSSPPKRAIRRHFTLH